MAQGRKLEGEINVLVKEEGVSMNTVIKRNVNDNLMPWHKAKQKQMKN